MSGVADDLSEHHAQQLIEYLSFARTKRTQHVAEIESVFDDVKTARLVEDEYKVEDVERIIDNLAATVKATMDTELMTLSHVNVLCLRQLFEQAQQHSINLFANTSTLENEALLDATRKYEETYFSLKAAGATMADLAGARGGLPKLDDKSFQLRHQQMVEQQKTQQENLTLQQQMAELRTKVDHFNEDLNLTRMELSAAKAEAAKAKEDLQRIKAENAALLAAASSAPAAAPAALSTPTPASANKLAPMSLAPLSSSSSSTAAPASAPASAAAAPASAAPATATAAAAAAPAAAGLDPTTKQVQTMRKLIQAKNEQIKTLRVRLAKYEEVIDDVPATED